MHTYHKVTNINQQASIIFSLYFNLRTIDKIVYRANFKPNAKMYSSLSFNELHYKLKRDGNSKVIKFNAVVQPSYLLS